MKMKPSPRHSAADIAMTAAGFLGLSAVTGYIAIKWASIPEEIPSHYNMAGEVDAMGGKGLLIFLLITAWGLWVMLGAVTLILKVCDADAGIGVDQRKQEKNNRTLKTMVELLKLFLAVAFIYIIVCTITARSLGWYFIPLFLISIFGTIIVSVTRVLRNQ